MTYWHGGRYPSSGVLEPQPLMRAGVAGDGFVYITTERDLAATYASTLTGSWVMQVEPIGRVEPDPDSMLGTSFRCRAAIVLRRYSLSNDERAARSASVGILPGQARLFDLDGPHPRITDGSVSFNVAVASPEEFRVALASHDRKVKAQAWDEGYMAVPAEPGERETFVEDADNPYR